MKYCCVYGCTNSSKAHPHLSFHILPENKDMKKEWLELIDRSELLEKKSASYRVCSAHFSDDMMIINRKVKPNAIPTLLLPGSNVLSSSSSLKNDAEIQTNTPSKDSETKSDKEPTKRKFEEVDDDSKQSSTSEEKLLLAKLNIAEQTIKEKDKQNKLLQNQIKCLIRQNRYKVKKIQRLVNIITSVKKAIINGNKVDEHENKIEEDDNEVEEDDNEVKEEDNEVEEDDNEVKEDDNLVVKDDIEVEEDE